ncbi:DNA polymerase subunit gamma-1-like protein [Aphelenchoides avenae]|nr:DNA polymerase subunit gamma-1-like protein [Aphelenchus avenae]
MAQDLFAKTKGVTKGYREVAAWLPEVGQLMREFFATDGQRFLPDVVCVNGRLFLPTWTDRKRDYESATYQFRITVTDFSDVAKDFWIWALERSRRAGTDIGQDELQARLFANKSRYELYSGGFESETFNYLVLKSLESAPRTPVLGCRLSQALEPLSGKVPGAKKFQQHYKRTVVNWVVQSSAVDFLHMLIVAMEWLCKEYDIRARFVISIHDEIRYLVEDEDRYRCALALCLSNMYVRAAFSSHLGIKELPRYATCICSIAFFNQVDIDTVLRKEMDTPCKTPNGELVPPGEAVNMKLVVEKTGGSLKKYA